MDFYQQNLTTLRRLLTKRQNPSTQIFKTQPSNPTNGPMPTMNLHRNCVSTNPEEKPFNFSTQNSTAPIIPPNNFSQFPPQTTLNSTPSQTFPTDASAQIEEEDNDEDPILEGLQKKTKTSMLTTTDLKSQRRLSCEEEKEECDHSTSCETRSEFNIANEAGDFLLSPPIVHQYSKDPSELKLDGDDSTLPSETPLQNFISDEETLCSKTIQDIAQQVEESFNVGKLPLGSKIKTKCKLNHQYEMDMGATTKKSCPRCEELLGECKEFAKKNQGSCVNEEYDENIRYLCVKGHTWTFNYKNARRRWCAQCAKEQRAFLKKKCEEEKMERERQEEEYQRKLFEEAKKKAATESSPPKGFNNMSGNGNGCGNQKNMSTLEYFQRIDYEIETLAKKYTVEFMSQKGFAGDISFQQILQVYKILIMPEEILQSYMFNLNADTLRSEFRRMAKIIHPDKNKHPQAGNAFQKIYKVYEVALSRLEGTQQKI